MKDCQIDSLTKQANRGKWSKIYKEYSIKTFQLSYDQ